MKKIGLALALLGSLIGSANAQSIQQYFGYFNGDVPASTDATPSVSLTEFKDHINLYHIQNWSGDESAAGRAVSKRYLLDTLATAKAAHVHAIIPGYAFLFQKTGTQCWQMDTGAQAAWNDLVQDLVSHGYLDQQHPDRSVVSAVYVVDEPNLVYKTYNSCLQDTSGGLANPALVNAVNAIRSNPNTNTIPLASVMAVMQDDFGDIRQGLQLFNWVGFDKYTDTDSQWDAHFAKLKQASKPGTKYIIVPGAQSVAIPDVCVGTNDTPHFIGKMNSDPSIVWMAPFVWYTKSPQCGGVRDNPSLKATYTSFGAGIKAQGCASSKDAGRFCKPPSIAPILDVILND